MVVCVIYRFAIARWGYHRSMVICLVIGKNLNREQDCYSREQDCCSLCLTCWVIDRNTGLSASGVADTRGMGFCITRGVVAHSVVMCVVCWVFIPRIDLWGENLFEPHCACVCARPSFVNAVQHVV